MIDIFKEYISRNPSKVLGEITETTDKFGNPDIKIVGDFENIERIDVSDSVIPSKNKEVYAIESHQFSDSIENQRIEESIRLTEDKNKSKSKPKKSTRKKKSKSIFIEGDNAQEIYTAEESVKQLNEGITEQDLIVWAWYTDQRGINQSKFMTEKIPQASDHWFSMQLKGNRLCFNPDTKEYLPSPMYYSGNIYDKLISIQNNKSVIAEFGLQEQIGKQYKNLNNILPPKLKLTGDKDERLVLSVLSKFVRDFKLQIDDNQSLLEAFKDHIRSLSASDLVYNVRTYSIINYYINGNRMPNHYDKVEKVDIKRKAAQECVIQMAKFLAEELPSSERERIEYDWNRTHNGYVDVNYDKIPVILSYSKYFKDGDLSIRDAQREGVAFQVANDTGIIAYDVGVGKTLTAILTVGNAMQSGLCKRPLIVVPKPTYDKWISEINGIYDDEGNLIGSGILPQYKLCTLFNLNKNISSKIIDKKGNFIGIPENTITVCTYEGLSKMGFGDDLESEFISELKEILNQGFGDASERQRALEDEKLNKIIGVAQEGTILNIDEAKFDYLVIDEAHNFNKIFSSVKGEVSGGSEGRDRNQYRVMGSQSSRAVKAFFVSNYIQKYSKLGNICLLTATPFTNNPLEVFNMLALTNIGRLKSLGVKNIVSFFDNYVNQTFEKIIKSTGEIQEAAVIKGWNNKVALQKILFSYMNYKSGEDANIQRPEKWTLPKLSETVDGVVIPLSFEDRITTFLNPTEKQKQNQKEISRWLIEQMKDEELAKKAPHLVADIKAKKNCISPYIYEGVNPLDITPKDFIKSSPKLSYTMDCVRSVVEWHKKDKSPLSCQVIYINGGIDYLHLIKRYLEEEIGYKKNVHEYKRGKFFDEVEILAGSGNFKRNDDEKEEIKSLFNNGDIKIIIGTSTIREGIDLQVSTSSLYSLWVDWNPTDYKQLEGRVWRYGNQYANVRITTPLLVGSSDAFTFQKLEEKTARINDIFDRNDKSNILDMGEEDRESIKWALVDDLTEIAKYKITEEYKEIKKSQQVLTDNLESLKSVDNTLSQLNQKIDRIKQFSDSYFKYVDQSKIDKDFEKGNPIEEYKKIRTQKDNIENQLSENNESTWDFNRNVDGLTYTVKEIKKLQKEIDRTEEKVKEKYGSSIYSDDLQLVMEKIASEIEEVGVKLVSVKSDKHFEEVLTNLEEEKVKFNSGISTYQETVDMFTSLNYLLGDVNRKEQIVQVEETEAIEVESTETSSALKTELVNIIEYVTDELEEAVEDKNKELIEAYELYLDGLKDLLEDIE
tara:strand:+ start:5637 stop:9491 length:3855 start_codon:yes stop_codon:yes gene_type:complete